MDPSEIRQIEELCLNAWPALRQMNLDGWVLRFADGCTRRSNSVHPLYPGTEEVERKIEACAAQYTRQRLPLLFKMTGAVQPADLDAVLERLGFESTAPTSVQTCRLEDQQFGDTAITCWDQPAEQWLDFTARFIGIGESQKPVLSRIVHSMALPTIFGAIVEDGQVRAGGLAVRDGSWVGLFDIATAPDFRRRGYARRLLHALLHRARSQGAYRAYLQVTLENRPAQHLYDTLGFREAYRYWYRKRP